MSDKPPPAGLELRADAAPRGPSARFLSERVRPKNARKTLARLLGLVSRRRTGILLVLLLGAGTSLAALAAPWLIGKTLDSLINRPETLPLALIPALLAVYLFDALASRLQARVLTRLAQELVRDLREALFACILALPMATQGRYERGDLMSRMNNDAEEVAQALSQTGAQIVGLAVNIAGSVLCMLLLSPLLTLVALSVVPLMFLLTTLVSRQTRRWFRAQQGALGALNAHMEESVNGFTEVKAFEREALLIARFETLNREHCTNATRAQLWAGLVMPMMNVINNLGFALITGMGSLLVLSGRLSPGLIAAFIGYSKQFGRPINELASTWSSFQAAIAGAERIFAILDEPKEAADAPGARILAAPSGRITFDSVSFSYHPGRPVLQDISLDVAPGSTVALVGPTGSGKTSLVNLLLAWRDCDQGRILFDGEPFAAWTRMSLRKAFSVVPQDCWLGSGTIAEVIAYGKPEATQEEIEEAAHRAHAHPFISLLPQGYQTPLGEGSLSQGQRQLLAIARAALLDTPCLILDEATSTVDTRTELHVQEAMLSLMASRTCFVIAHRLSTILKADLIVLLDGGRIVEAGSHEELLSRGGRYRALWQASTLRA